MTCRSLSNLQFACVGPYEVGGLFSRATQTCGRRHNLASLKSCLCGARTLGKGKATSIYRDRRSSCRVQALQVYLLALGGSLGRRMQEALKAAPSEEALPARPSREAVDAVPWEESSSLEAASCYFLCREGIVGEL